MENEDWEIRTICSNCGAEFAEEVELDKHREDCNEKIDFACMVCTKIFSTESELDIHVQLHSSDDLTCEKCGRMFRHVEHFVHHHRNECAPTANQVCHLCDEKFHFKAHLNTHLLENHSEVKVINAGEPSEAAIEERYKCKICPRAFTRVGSLNYHVSRKHSGTSEERDPVNFPFSCSDCGNRYKSATQLCRHRRWECGKEPMFKCNVCVKKFHHRHGLKQHIQLHVAKSSAVTDSAQFCCEKCGRGYKLKSSLNNHMKWECGKEPVFNCTVCNVNFSHKGNLKKHILTKHLDKQPAKFIV